MNLLTAEIEIDWMCLLLSLVGGGMAIPEPMLGLLCHTLG